MNSNLMYRNLDEEIYLKMIGYIYCKFWSVKVLLEKFVFLFKETVLLEI